MEKLLKIDPHVHSSTISLCSRIGIESLIDEKIKLGFDGAVLTNHCQAWYYPKQEHKYFIERVIEEFNRGKAYAAQKGFRLFLGIEVTIDVPHYSDWLLYGVSEEFLRASPCLYALTQKELFELCEKWDIVLIQAHPYRQAPCEPNYMHGVEINCTRGDLEKADKVEAFAAKHNLLVTCGTDYHSKEQTYFGGILIPESCQSAEELARHIRENNRVTVIREGEIKEYQIKI